MAVIGNLFWFICGGFLLGVGWYLFSFIFFWIPPLSSALKELGKYCFLPFGKQMMKETDVYPERSASKIQSWIKWVWLPIGLFWALWMLLSSVYILLVGLIICIFIITIPIGVIYFSIAAGLAKIAIIGINPIGMVCVTSQKALAIETAKELAKRQQG